MSAQIVLHVALTTHLVDHGAITTSLPLHPRLRLWEVARVRVRLNVEVDDGRRPLVAHVLLLRHTHLAVGAEDRHPHASIMEDDIAAAEHHDRAHRQNDPNGR